MTEDATGSSSIRRWLREPLLHFVVLGVALFGLYQLAVGPAGPGDDEIVVTVGQIDQIVEIFTKIRQRAPTPQELTGLIDEHIVEEVLYREAMAMGLEEDDTIIRRRLRQKLEFLVDDFAATQPTDEELTAFLAESPERYRLDARISFEHVFFPEEALTPATEALAALRASPSMDVSAVGENLPLPADFTDTAENDISAVFGDDFKDAIFSLDVGTWEGPVESPFGVHLVRVNDRVDGRTPTLEEARGALERDWLSDRRTMAQDAFVDQLRAQYEISVELEEWANTDEPAVAEIQE